MNDDLKLLLNKDNIASLKKITDYLNINPLATLMEVAERTGVSSSLLTRFINAGILKMREPYKPNFSQKTPGFQKIL